MWARLGEAVPVPVECNVSAETGVNNRAAA